MNAEEVQQLGSELSKIARKTFPQRQVWATENDDLWGRYVKC